MSISDRDRKILILIVPVLLIVGYWLLLLGPKREEADTVAQTRAKHQTQRDLAQAKAARLDGAKASFAEDYAEMIRLGKAIPRTLDMPSLLVQLDRAARGTGISFDAIKEGERAPAAASSAAASPPAQSGPGKAAETTEKKVGEANADTAASQSAQSGNPPASTPAPGAGAPQGLDAVPLELGFSGTFFDLTQLLHRLKRFVRVANDRILVRGRLLTVDGFQFESSDSSELKVTLKATVFLAPKDEAGATGATPDGPASAPGTQAAPASPASTPPAAAVTP